jgi:GAF domain-containing protein/HAMP domain-containing protein
MSISRKILLPLIAFFALVFIALIGLFVANFFARTRTESIHQLEQLNRSLDAHIYAQEELALALAAQQSSNPAVQKALASSNRNELLALTQSAYQTNLDGYDVTEFQFHTPPAIAFLRVQNPDQFGEDESETRPSVAAANTRSKVTSGIEYNEEGLSVRGIVPIIYQGSHIGTTDIGINIDEALVDSLKGQYGGDWNMLVYDSSTDMELGEQRPVPNLSLKSSTTDPPIFASSDAYSSAIQGETAISEHKYKGQQYIILSMPISGGSGETIGVIDIITNRSASMGALRNRVLLILMFTFICLLAASVCAAVIIRYVLRPISELNTAVQAITKGDLSSPDTHVLKARRGFLGAKDEITELEENFDIMRQQMQGLVENLEHNVAIRTQDLELRSIQLQTAAEVARDVTTTTNLDRLLSQSVNLIRERFDFYHAGIFLLDDDREYAVLAAATGEAGRLMLANGHRLKVGEVGIVGAATGTGVPRIALDVGEDIAHFQNPLLPDTHSEMALPLRVGSQVIGALDVQSSKSRAFNEDDITTLQIMADQLAVAIVNARLITQLNETVEELEQSYGRYTQESWREFATRRNQTLGYRYDQLSRLTTSQDADDLSPEANEALLQGQVVLDQASDTDPDSGSKIAVPIMVRDDTIGVLNMCFDKEKIDPETRALIEEATSRLALVLESARLLGEAQRLAAREVQINWIATQVSGSVNIETILQNTVRELGKSLGASRTFIQVGSQSGLERKENGGNDNGAHSAQDSIEPIFDNAPPDHGGHQTSNDDRGDFPGGNDHPWDPEHQPGMDYS